MRWEVKENGSIFGQITGYCTREARRLRECRDRESYHGTHDGPGYGIRGHKGYSGFHYGAVAPVLIKRVMGEPPFRAVPAQVPKA